VDESVYRRPTLDADGYVVDNSGLQKPTLDIDGYVADGGDSARPTLFAVEHGAAEDHITGKATLFAESSDGKESVRFANGCGDDDHAARRATLFAKDMLQRFARRDDPPCLPMSIVL
jgi:hypothetical protein